MIRQKLKIPWKTQKNLEKGIDKGDKEWYNGQAVVKKAGANGHWKLNNKR